MYPTGTVVDEVTDFSRVALGGLGPGLVVVWDEGPGYVAVTEFCARVVAASQSKNTVWLDPRYQLGDGANLIRVVPELPSDMLVVAPRGGVDGQTLLNLLEWVFLGPWQVASQSVLAVLDSLPAITDVALQPTVINAAMHKANELCQQYGSLLLVGNYAVSGQYGLNAVSCRQLNALAHTQVRVRHEGGKLGVSVPICRRGVPRHTWSWVEALVEAGE